MGDNVVVNVHKPGAPMRRCHGVVKAVSPSQVTVERTVTRGKVTVTIAAKFSIKTGVQIGMADSWWKTWIDPVREEGGMRA